MASALQIVANKANALLSTGPKTPEGKAKSARNNTRHGLTFGFLYVEPAEEDAFCEFEANLREELNPEGPIEEEAFLQFRDAAWRLEKIYALLNELHIDDVDPLVNPEVAAQFTQLNRYRAAAEMQLYRSIKLLRQLHNDRIFRQVHLREGEAEDLPALVTPRTILSRPFVVPVFANSKPIDAACVAASPPVR
ncbi:MAG: hypothetical protein FJW38_00410 [Acidobacteria bacterium]|nr:hypothetical protein [Acidobacteriota bacterium]